MATWVNGQRTQQLTVYDRGLNYGDGVFETMRVSRGAIALQAGHQHRLATGCARLGIQPPDNVWHEVARAAKEQGTGMVKLTVTRGAGGRGYRADPDAPAHWLVRTADLPPTPANVARNGGVSLRFAATRLAYQPQLAGIKHLNRLEQVLAANEAGECDDRIMCDYDDVIIDTTKANIFIVRAGALMTPALAHAGVAGVMREWLINHAERVGISCTVSDMTHAHLQQADEVFICNALRGIWPVVAIDEQTWSAGPLTQQLASAVASLWA